MRYLLCLVIFGSSFVQSLAQRTDSLKQALARTTIDTTRSLLYSALADELNNVDASEATSMAKQGLALSQRVNFDKGIFENAFAVGEGLQGLALFDSSLQYFRQAEKIAIRYVAAS